MAPGLAREKSIEPLMILTGAWWLIQGGWCQKALARDRWRHAVDLASPKATRFCVAGALIRAALDCGLAELDADAFEAESWRPQGSLDRAFAFTGKQFAHVFDMVGVRLETFDDGVTFVGEAATQEGSADKSEAQLPWWRLVVAGNDMRLASRELIDAVLTMAINDVCSEIRSDVLASGVREDRSVDGRA